MASKSLFAAVAAVMCGLQCAAAASPRLRETPVNLEKMRLEGVDPVDPDGDHGPKRIAGFFELNRTEAAEMFYFYFESRKDPDNDPLVIWMTGGPGCSSELAVFYEQGPYKINEDLTLRDNPHGWDTSHNMIFVDQPIGTGFSYSDSPKDRVTSERGVADDMLDFLQEFFDAHPEVADNQVFVTGESYAGHYVPAVSHRIWQYNKAPSGMPINFKGLAIGNGLTDPAIQYGAYADYAFQNNLISKAVQTAVNAAYPPCRVAINACNAHPKWHGECLAAHAYCQEAVFATTHMAAGNINVYDIRKKCVGSLCYDFSRMEEYLGQPSVKQALGVEGRSWVECNAVVYGDFLADWMLEYATMLPEMLEDGVRVMIYAGDQDFICNWLGNRRWVDAMQWDGAEGWSAAEDLDWEEGGNHAGLFTKSGPLSFVKVFGAGHMVPMDKGANSLHMIHKFTRNQALTQPPPPAPTHCTTGRSCCAAAQHSPLSNKSPPSRRSRSSRDGGLDVPAAHRTLCARWWRSPRGAHVAARSACARCVLPQADGRNLG